MPTLIRPLAEGSAGESSRIAVGAFDDGEVVSALRDGSGDLELIGWRVAAADFAVTREADSGSQAGEVSEVALALLGRRAITAVRSGSDRLLLISWDVPPGLGSITRTWDSGTTAGEASEIAITVLGDDLLVTACREGDGRLLVISWRLEPDGTISRLHDSASQAGEVSVVTIAAIDVENVVTAVRNGSNNLELIGWRIPASGVVQRWADSGTQAGEVSEIALTTLPSTGPTADLVTAVQNGSGDLELISWRPSPVDGTIQRLADSAGAAGEASAISVCTTETASGPKVIASMRRGSGNLELIAFQIVGDGAGAIVRTGDYTNEADSNVSETALLHLEPGRILAATCVARSCEWPPNHLLLTTYSVRDPVATPAPLDILSIRHQNPPLPDPGDSTWAASGGDEYPLDSDFEWVQALSHADEYEGSNLVGCTGWIVDPDDSGADVPFDHPMGFDWEFQIALDDGEGGDYQPLLSPANTQPEGHAPELAAALGVPVRRGLLGLEWDKSLLPASFRARVNHGDRVATFGRWILDTGHNFGGYWRTEIHPPLLVATGSVQEGGGSEFTRALFMTRPYLVGQTFTQDVDDAYLDGVDDDGGFFSHIVSELWRVMTLRSRHVEAHPKIKAFPFKGSYRLHVVVKPPRPRASRSERLAVSFQFTVRQGCNVRVSSSSPDQIDVIIEMSSAEYEPPDLPPRNECVYGPDQLDKLSSGAGIRMEVAEWAATALSALLPWGGIFLSGYVKYILDHGITTDRYDALAAFDVMDASRAVIDAPASNIPAGQGVSFDDAQHHPVFGWIEAKWIARRHVAPGVSPAEEATELTNVEA